MLSYGFGELFFLLITGGLIWVAWKFYEALVRIGDELQQINTSLRQRNS